MDNNETNRIMNSYNVTRGDGGRECSPPLAKFREISLDFWNYISLIYASPKKPNSPQSPKLAWGVGGVFGLSVPWEP